MRVSTRYFLQQGIDAIGDQQSIVSKTQLQISAGKRILTPSDDPVAATQVLGINQEIARTEQLQKNIDFARARLNLEETTLKAVDQTFFRIRELVVQGLNTILPPESRNSISTELELRLSEMIGLANTKDGTGEYIFAGFNGRTVPFNRDPSGTLIYTGDEGQRQVQVASSVQLAVSDSGHAVFQNIDSGNGNFVASDAAGNIGTGIIDPGAVIDPVTYGLTDEDYTINFQLGGSGQLQYTVDGTVSGVGFVGPIDYVEGASISFNGILTSIKGTPDVTDTFTLTRSTKQSIFSTIENAITGIGITDETGRVNAMNRVLTDLDQALENFSNIRAKIGARLNTLDIEEEVNTSFLVFQKSNRSRLEDLDFTEAASELSRQTLALEAAQSSFVRIQNLSLFNFLR